MDLIGRLPPLNLALASVVGSNWLRRHLPLQECRKMSEHRSTDLMTVAVLGSEAFIRPDGRAAIRLDTNELGPIAFEADRTTIDSLRQTLANAETFLHQRHGHS